MRLSQSLKAIISPQELNHLLQLCNKFKSLKHGKQVHNHIITIGLNQNPFLVTKLVQIYADCNYLESARYLFDKLSRPNVFAWTAILAFYSRNGLAHECLLTYGDMRVNLFLPDKYVFPIVFRSVAQLLWLEIGVRVHKEVILFGCESNLQICNAMINMYSKCGDVISAKRVFNEMVEQDLLSWNSMISGYVYNGFLKLAVDLWNLMRMKGTVEPDIITLNTVMDNYCRMEQCDEAWKIFEKIKGPSLISWTTLISGYSRIGKHEVSLMIFKEMIGKGGVKPDWDSLSSILVSCRNLETLIIGREIHGYGIKIDTDYTFYTSAGAALLTMYTKCNRIYESQNVFKLMDKYDVVTWNAMILGYVHCKREILAIEWFGKMQIVGIKPDEITIATVLPVCDLKSGKQIHAYMRKITRFDSNISVWNALVHMYSKCGCIEAAYYVFRNMAVRDLVSWNTMIAGFGNHGHGKEAVNLLKEMKQNSVCPNAVTFTSALSACSHSGLIDEGLQLFHSMSKDFNLDLKTEHIGCIVDSMARSGRVEEAADLMNKTAVNHDKSIWGALLAASQDHQNVSVAKLAAEQLFILEPEDAGNYVTLSNIYVRAGKWDEAVELRKVMEGRGLIKPSGYSWIGINR